MELGNWELGKLGNWGAGELGSWGVVNCGAGERRSGGTGRGVRRRLAGRA